MTTRHRLRFPNRDYLHDLNRAILAGAPPDFDPKKFVTAEVVRAALGGVSSVTLLAYRRKGILPHVRLNSRRFLYEWAAIENILRGRVPR